MTTPLKATLLAMLCYAFPSAQAAVVTVYTDFALWSAAVSGITTLDFETPDASGGNQVLGGNEYAGLNGSPTLSYTPTPGATVDTNLQVGEQRLEVGPVSGDQLLFPGLFVQGQSGNGGVLRLTTSAPIVAAGGFFIDIESGDDSTGFDLDLDGTIDVLFSVAYPVNPGDGAQVFLGFTTATPISSVDVHLNEANVSPNTGQGAADGVGLDDLSFSIVPVPAAAWLLGSGLALLGWLGRRTRL